MEAQCRRQETSSTALGGAGPGAGPPPQPLLTKPSLTVHRLWLDLPHVKMIVILSLMLTSFLIYVLFMAFKVNVMFFKVLVFIQMNIS